MWRASDPLGVSDPLPVYYLCDSELKHGRVRMLAVVGRIAIDVGMLFPGKQLQTISAIDAQNQMAQLGLTQPMLATAFFMEVHSYRLIVEGLRPPGRLRRAPRLLPPRV